MQLNATLSAPPLVATVGAPDAAAPLPLRPGGPAFSDLEALIRSGLRPDVVLLRPHAASEALDWLLRLRRDARLGLAASFCDRDYGEASAALADGVVQSVGQLADCAAQLASRGAALPKQEYPEGDERLLAFLYLRPGHRVSAVRDWRSERIWRYPLLESFAPPQADTLDWSLDLRRRRLLEPVELVDRVRLCPHCSGGHLSFVDLCPHCASLDIAEEIFLHCHACGNVARQDEYLCGDGLVCRKCTARLRHIGVDYDRALENWACASCEGRFTEADVRARCLHCGRLHATEALEQRRIQTLKISEAGMLAARTGTTGDLFALVDELNGAHPAYFERTLEWQLALAARHPELRFGLVCIRFANLQQLLADLPRTRVAQLLDGFAARLRQLVRTTDLVMRSDDRTCWLLLPQTPPEGVDILAARLERIPEATDGPPEERLRLAVARLASAELTGRQPGATVLMGEILARVS